MLEAAAIGISYEDLINDILEAACARYGLRAGLTLTPTPLDSAALWCGRVRCKCLS